MNKSGFSLIEVLISIIIFAVAMTGGMAFFFYLSSIAVSSSHEKVATQLATSKMEEIRYSVRNNYSVVVNSNDSVTIGASSGGFFNATRSWFAPIDTTGNGYREAQVSMTWWEPGRHRNEIVNLITYIANTM